MAYSWRIPYYFLWHKSRPKKSITSKIEPKHSSITMALINWLNSPLDVVTPFPRNVDRFFFDALADIDSRITKKLDRASDVYTPNLDISEDADNFYILAELPGLTQDDVKVTIDNDILTIQGRK